MGNASGYVISAIVMGVVATATTDLWTIVRKRLGGVALPDYGLVGRWIAYMPRGRFHHEAISASPPIRGERAIGWIAHYLIGIAFASSLLAIWGLGWVRQPTIGPALIVGIVSVAAPFLLLQPGMGAGIAASRTPKPAAARVRSVVVHAVFGLGLYLAGWAARGLLFGDPSSP
jgi:hypothetical protein